MVCVFAELAVPSLTAQSPPVQPAPNQRSVEEVIRELEAMKQRVEQLEALLKARLPDQGTTPLSAEPPRPSTAAAVPSGQVAQQQHPAAQAAPAPDTTTPFAFADFTWLNGVPRNKDEVLDSKYFTGEFRADTSYIHDYEHPIDHSLGGTTEGARTGEVQVQHLGVGGDFHAGNMQGRVLTPGLCAKIRFAAL